MSRIPCPIRYRLTPLAPSSHCLRVCCDVPEPAPQGQVFSLPVWIPGSYLVREFARNVVALRARAGGVEVALTKLDKARWRAAPVPAGQALSLEYEVYAWEESVRAAFYDDERLFFNGSSVFMLVEGQRGTPCRLLLDRPPGLGHWQVATGLAFDETGPHYHAADYDALIDHPVEMGTLDEAGFEVCGVPHAVVLSGRHDCTLPRLCQDLARVCAEQVAVFGQAPPFDRYLFLTRVLGQGYGGLEHANSTALIVRRNDLPHPALEKPDEGYLRFLGLCSHEYFHAWHVKRLRPAELMHYDYSGENYTRLLWLFEGFTSYYDDLALVRAGLVDEAGYLQRLAGTLAAVLKNPGHRRQSLADASFDAWIKYYRPDENAANALTSYYTKGAMVALILDLRLRAQSAGQVSLDDLMRALWACREQGVTDGQVYALAAELGGPATGTWLREAVETCDPLPVAEALAAFGIVFSLEAEQAGVGLWARSEESRAGHVRLTQVLSDGAAARAGLWAGDELVAFEGFRLTPATLKEMLARHLAGATVRIDFFRGDCLRQTHLTLMPAPADTVRLSVRADAEASQHRMREGWLASLCR